MEGWPNGKGAYIG